MVRYAGAAFAAAAILAACSANQQAGSPTMPATSQQRVVGLHSHPHSDLKIMSMSTRAGLIPTIHRNLAHSWMRRDATKQWLLYVSDIGTASVEVYNYRAKPGKLYGTITGFSAPYGQCVDKSRNVYIVDNGTAMIYEFAHGGLTPIASASDNYGYPIGCSVDPTTGNVAVANFYGFSGSGGIDVFSGGLGGSQTYYTNANQYYMWPPGYDQNGNLYVEGQNTYFNSPSIAELPSGSGTFNTVTGVSVTFPGSVQRVGKNMEFTDQEYSGSFTDGIYIASMAGSAGTIVHTVQLTDTCNASYMDSVQPYIDGTIWPITNAIVTGNLDCTYDEGFWNLATGGNPKRTLPSNIAPVYPYGQSVSKPI